MKGQTEIAVIILSIIGIALILLFFSPIIMDIIFAIGDTTSLVIFDTLQTDSGLEGSLIFYTGDTCSGLTSSVFKFSRDGRTMIFTFPTGKCIKTVQWDGDTPGVGGQFSLSLQVTHEYLEYIELHTRFLFATVKALIAVCR